MKKNVKIFIVVLILGLLTGMVVGWSMFVYRENKEDENLSAVKQNLSADRLHDSYNKITNLPHGRGLANEATQTNSRRVIAMIRGGLGLRNVGYAIREGSTQKHDGYLWKNYWLEKEGSQKGTQPVVIAVSYHPASQGEEAELSNAADLSTMIEAATVLAGRETRRSVRFCFCTSADLAEPAFENASQVLWLDSTKEPDLFPKSLEELQTLPTKEGAYYLGWPKMNEVSSFLRLPKHGQELIDLLTALAR